MGAGVTGALALLALTECGPDAANVPLLRSDHCPVGGCVDSSTSSGIPDAGPIPNEPLEGWDTTGAGPLTGIYAVLSVISAKVVVPVELRQLFRLRIVQKGTEIHQKTTLCVFKLPSVPNVATLTIPEPLQELIQNKAVEVDGLYLSSASVLNATYAPPPFLLVVGAMLPNPATDPLPTMDDPTNELDEDMDGHPGVTIDAQVLTCTSTQQLYAALRTSGVVQGTVTGPNTIQGTFNVKVNQSVLGYSDMCLAAAANIVPLIEPNSPFTAQRLGASYDLNGDGNITCPEIEIAAPGVFGEAWTGDGGP